MYRSSAFNPVVTMPTTCFNIKECCIHSANGACLRVSSEAHKKQQLFGGCLDVLIKKQCRSY
jgi:hypothetical protein